MDDPGETFISNVMTALKALGIEYIPNMQKPKKDNIDLCLICFPIAKELNVTNEKALSMIIEKMPSSDLYTLEISDGYLNCIFDKEAKRKKIIKEWEKHLKEKGYLVN
jgi:hypothetical protein